MPSAVPAQAATIHVAPRIVGSSSGISAAALQLCDGLRVAGETVVLATVEGDAGALPPFVRTFDPGLGPRRLGRSPALRRFVGEELRRGGADVVHVHGLWRMSTVQPASLARAAGAALVVAPHGSLAPWAMRFRAAVKRPFWWALQRPALERVTCWHAASDAEYEDIRRLGFSQPVAVSPYGVRLPPLRLPRPQEDRTLLFLARIHPKKGVDTLIDAWRLVQDRFPRWRLVIAGTEADKRGYLAEVRSHAAARGAERVTFVGELTGRARDDAYGEAQIYVLPTRSENFGFTVAEALAAGTPVITTTASPWRELEARAAGWWIRPGVEALAACLGEALATEPSRLREMGLRGRKWMEADFVPSAAGRRMAATYAWLRGRAERPDWIRVEVGDGRARAS